MGYIVIFFLLAYLGLGLFLYVVQEKMLFPARKISSETTLNFSSSFEEFFLDTSDGDTLNAVHFKSDSSQGIVLHFHGNGENIMDMEFAAEPFLEIGYDFMAMDYRSYGKSTGTLSEQKLYDDALLFWIHLEESGWKPNQIVLYGRSIGTGIATQLASVKKPKAVILHSPYYSMTRLVQERFPIYPAGIILKYPLNTAQYLKKLTCPVLLLHGKKDPLIPYHHSERLAQIQGKLISFEDGDHINLSYFPKFQIEIETFLETH